jgi:TfoX/Sxy family transcriptional regulator of competence genes
MWSAARRGEHIFDFGWICAMAYDERTAERIREVLSSRHDVIEKKMMGGLCFMVKGGMCCTVSGRGGMLVRVRAEEREALLREPHVRPMEMGVRTMTGFVRVAPEGYQTAATLKKWVQRGLDAATARSTKPAAAKRRGLEGKSRRRPARRTG